MKKVISMLLCFALILSLTACGQSERDKKFDELVSQGTTGGTSDVENMPASDPDGLSANLILRTYSIDAGLWEDYIREFNETYPNIHIEVKLYDLRTVSSDTYISQTTVELMSGEAGDILDLSYLPAYRYSASGVLKELDGFMEADPDFAGDKYYTNIIDAMHCNGKIYTMPYEFTPLGIRLDRPAADSLQTEYGTGVPIKVSDVLRLSAQAEIPALAMSSWAAFNFMEFSSRIDENKKTADLDSESFVQYLKDLKAVEYSAKAGPSAYPMPDDGNLGGGFASIVTLAPTVKRMMEGYQDMLSSNAVTPLMALETDEGGRLFSAFSLAITSACEDDEAAFAFIKFMLDCDRKLDTGNDYHSNLGPVNREIHQKLLKLYLDDGAEAEALDAWYTQLNQVVFYDRNIELQNKLNDICDQYMRDLLSAEDCAKQMQGVADIYLNE